LNARLIASICLLAVVSCLLMPLLVSCIDLVLASPVSLEQTSHLNRGIRILFVTCLTLPLIAAHLLYKRWGRRPTKVRRILAFVLTVAGCAAGSLLAGVAIRAAAELHWNPLALALFG